MSSAPIVYESFLATPTPALTVIDQFAKERGLQGAFPAPVGPLAFTIVSQITPAGPVLFDPPFQVDGYTNPTGFYLLSNEVTRGSSTVYFLPPGDYTVQVESDFYQPAQLVLTWPAAVQPDWPPPIANRPVLILYPAAPYPFPDLTPQIGIAGITLVRGSVFLPDGSPNLRAIVSITAPAPAAAGSFHQCVTNGAGDWVIVIPDLTAAKVVSPLAITLHLDFGDGTSSDVPLSVTLCRENSLPQTALRGLVTSASGVPVAQATIAVSGQAATSLSRKDGQWSYYFNPLQPAAPVQVTATAPNGQNASQAAKIVPGTTGSVPPIRIPI